MFQGCDNLVSIDLRNFDVSKVENAERMFGWCDNLTTIYCDSSWDLTNANTELMFFNSTNLVGAVPYNQEQVDGAMANPVTGYFTYKGMPGDANNDGKVDVNDVTTVINYILSKNPSPFIYDNANVNGDDSINVMDVTLIINIILGIH
jgi:surface protein